jgi:hypothetical protein
MVRCKEFYKRFSTHGNFCEKSPILAKQIERYIDYCKRHDIEDMDVNQNALTPLMSIEGEMVHDMSLTELKSRLEGRLRAKDVTRKLVIEIIKTQNDKVNKGDSRRLVYIPNANDDALRYGLSIRDIRYRTRELFNELKNYSGLKTNDEFVHMMLLYCDENKNDFMEKVKSWSKVDEVEE